jgi:hypothetical protein
MWGASRETLVSASELHMGERGGRLVVTGGGVAMGFRVYKSVKLGKGVRLNLSKTGVGISAGVPALA